MDALLAFDLLALPIAGARTSKIRSMRSRMGPEILDQ